MVLLHSKYITDTNCKAWLHRLKRFYAHVSKGQHALLTWFMHALVDPKLRWWDVVHEIRKDIDADIADILNHGTVVLSVFAKRAEEAKQHVSLPECFQKLIHYCMDLPTPVLASNANSGTRLFLRTCVKHIPVMVQRWFQVPGNTKKWIQLLQLAGDSLAFDATNNAAKDKGGKQDAKDGKDNKHKPGMPSAHSSTSIVPVGPVGPPVPIVPAGAAVPKVRGGANGFGVPEFGFSDNASELKEAILMSKLMSSSSQDDHADYDSTWALIQDIMLILTPISLDEKNGETEADAEGGDSNDWRNAYFRALFVRHVFDDDRPFDSRLNEENVRRIVDRHCVTIKCVQICNEAFAREWKRCMRCWSQDKRLEFLRRQFSPLEFLHEQLAALVKDKSDLQQGFGFVMHRESMLREKKNEHSEDPWVNWFKNPERRPCTTLNVGRFCMFLLGKSAALVKDQGGDISTTEQTVQVIVDVLRLILVSVLGVCRGKLEHAYKQGDRSALHNTGIVLHCATVARVMWSHFSAVIRDAALRQRYIDKMDEMGQEWMAKSVYDFEELATKCEVYHEENKTKKITATGFDADSENDVDGMAGLMRGRMSGAYNAREIRDIEALRRQRERDIRMDLFHEGGGAMPAIPGHGPSMSASIIFQQLRNEFGGRWKTFVAEFREAVLLTTQIDKLNGVVRGFSLHERTHPMYAVPTLERLATHVLKTCTDESVELGHIRLLDPALYAGARMELHVNRSKWIMCDFEEPATLSMIRKHSMKPESKRFNAHAHNDVTSIATYVNGLQECLKDLQEHGVNNA